MLTVDCSKVGADFAPHLHIGGSGGVHQAISGMSHKSEPASIAYD